LALFIEYTIELKTKNSIPFTITYPGVEKVKNENIKLLKNAIIKKIPETVLIFVVVRDLSKRTPIVIPKVIARNIKLPKVNIILFSLA
jgi:hypothetical protein